MNKRTYALYLGMTLIGVLLGALLVYMVLSSPILVSSGHQHLASAMTVYDNHFNANLNLQFIGSGSRYLPTWATWPGNQSYPYSLWGFSYEGGIELYMRIVGPSTDGKTYIVEFSRVTWAPLTITVPAFTTTPVSTYTFPAVTGSGMTATGYVSIEVIP